MELNYRRLEGDILELYAIAFVKSVGLVPCWVSAACNFIKKVGISNTKLLIHNIILVICLSTSLRCVQVCNPGMPVY